MRSMGGRLAATVLVPLLAALSLSACSSGPSDSAKKEAVTDALRPMVSKSLEITEFKSGKCQKSEGAPGYACSITGTYTYTRKRLYELPDSLGGSKKTEEQEEGKFGGVFLFDQIDGKWIVTGRQ